MATIIVYWSGTGNTERMAEAVASGVSAAGGEPIVKNVSEVDARTAAGYDKVILGCPAMGAEVLEESEFQPYYDEIESLLRGKPVGLFGTYDWGDGEWMRNWEDTAKSAGLNVIATLAVQQDEDVEPQAKEFGRLFA